jgi:hypothetical protein
MAVPARQDRDIRHLTGTTAERNGGHECAAKRAAARGSYDALDVAGLRRLMVAHASRARASRR